MGNWIENSSEGRDVANLICTQKLGRHGFAAGSINGVQKIYWNNVCLHVSVHHATSVDLSAQWDVE